MVFASLAKKKYHCGHRCASRVFLLIADEEERCFDEYIDLGLAPEPPDTLDLTMAQLSLHSLAGHLA